MHNNVHVCDQPSSRFLHPLPTNVMIGHRTSLAADFSQLFQLKPAAELCAITHRVLHLQIFLVSLAMSVTVSDPPSQCLLVSDYTPPYQGPTISR